MAAREHWAEDRQWQKLLHFERTILGFFESQIDSPEFFFSPQGAHDLKAELTATIDAFYGPLPGGSDKDERLIPICRLPARASWMQRKIHDRLPFPQVSCPRFERFKQNLRGTGVSLVFSSYYLNNPSSAFGHTFLRINKEPARDGRRYELLDYGVNYAANKDTDNALLYALRGLFGGFEGTFTTRPYYYKVREYNNAESRDLWEYELNVAPGTVERLIEHIWELGPTKIDYWYLTENCSYHMFSILEAADPNLDLLSHVKKYVIPSDSGQMVWQIPGLVKSVHFRPSVRTELMARAKDLSEAEKNQLTYIMGHEEPPADFSKLDSVSQMHVLDTYIDFIDFKYAYDVQIENSSAAKLKNKFLILRSHIDAVTPDLKLEGEELEKPHLAHGSRRLGLGYLSNKETTNRYLLDYNFALHDQLDPVQGYPEYAQITFFGLRFSADEDRHGVQLEEWSLFEVLSATPASIFKRDLSWRFRMGTERVRNENCDLCRLSGISGGAGGTWQIPVAELTTLYVGARGLAEYKETDRIRYWLGVGPEARLRIRWTPQIISLVEAWQRYDFQGTERNYFERSVTTQFSAHNKAGVRIGFTDYGFDKATRFEGFYYY